MSAIIEPLDPIGQALATRLTQQYVERAGVLYGRLFEPIPVVYDLSGGAAGMYVYRRDEHRIRYNPWLFAKYPVDNLASTVPHEVAHYIVHQVYGLRGIRPHGPEWKGLMQEFGADPSVTANFDLEGIPQRRERRFSYRCDCRDHELSTRRHRAILRGSASYECRYCRSTLVANRPVTG